MKEYIDWGNQTTSDANLSDVRDNSTNEMLRKARQHNTTGRQSTTQHNFTQGSHFSRKIELPRVGLEPTTFCVLD